MRAEDNINMLKQIPPPSNFEKQRARRTAVVLAASTIISILFFIYAFLQKLEANKQAATAQKFRVEAEALRVEAENQREIAEQERKRTQSALQEAMIQHERAEQALADCKRN